jgi:predicted outer membrane repeat protein
MLRLRLTPSALLMFLILPALISLPAKAATFTVTNLNDSGSGSLRQAILEANIAPGDDTVQFVSGLSGTITLTSGELEITANLTINGPGAAQLAISGNNQSRIFNISSSGVIATIQGLSIKKGSGGGIWNRGALTINGSIFSDNSASYGGGIYNFSGATLNVNHSTFSGNSATSSGGGGIYSSGALTINSSTFSCN